MSSWTRFLLTAALAVSVLAQSPAPAPVDVLFAAGADGTQQRFILLLPAAFDGRQPHDVLVALHGHGSDRWQFVRPTRDETRAVLDVAARHGFILASPDYRATKSWMGPKAEADVAQIIQELRAQYRIGKVIVCGASMGGAAALTFAAIHPDLVAGVVSMNGTANHLEYENFQDAIQASFGGAKQQIPLEYKRRSAEYWPERLTMPVAITASGQDTVVPPQSVVRLAGILQKLGRKVLLIYRANEGHRTAYADAVSALEFAISPPGAPE